MDYLTIDPQFVDYTDVVMSFSVFPIQTIDKNIDDQNEKSLMNIFEFLIPSLSFVLLFFAGFLFYFASSFVFSYFKKLKKQSLQFKILSFAYLLFLFFMSEFFNGNLNTSNIIVSTDDLLYSTQQVLATRKEFCFLEKSSEFSVC